MNFHSLFAALVVFTVTVEASVTYEGDCHCWEEFKRVKRGEVYFCEGIKHKRIFMCGDVKPPVCKCKVDGQLISLDLGETNCLSVLQGAAGVWCDNKSEFMEYFRTHPEHDITSSS